jgi:coenzyme F420-0:L-glutamate ligase/coenzyme F420-1:gamma-L-glutamate ligase
VSTRVIVPYRGLEAAKTRLSPVLTPDERGELAAHLLRRVLRVAREAIGDVVVITPSAALEPIVTAAGARLEVQRGMGLNEGLEQAREAALADGVTTLVVLHGDLPELTADDVRALAAAVPASGGVAMAPDRAGSGTNGLALSPPDAIGFRFGVGSCAAHEAEAGCGCAARPGGAPRPWVRSRHARRPRRVAEALEHRSRAGAAVSVARLELVALEGIPEVHPGDDVASLIAAALGRAGIDLRDDDVLVVTQKIVSKAEGRVVELASVRPSEEALAFAERWGKDPRQVELVLRESREVVRTGPGGLIIARTRHGFVCANAGVDLSNVGGGEVATLLPVDPDASARGIRDRLGTLAGSRPGVVISDSFGRPWRLGIVNVAIGAAGLDALVDLRGQPDAQGREMRSTVIAAADELASAADLAGGKVAQRPVVLVRGYVPATTTAGEPGVRGSVDGGAASLVMPAEQDLFR